MTLPRCRTILAPTLMLILVVGLLGLVYLQLSAPPASIAAAANPSSQSISSPAQPAFAAATPTCGLAWSVVASPSVVYSDNALAAEAVVNANDVWAVGDYANILTSTYQTLTEHWNGTAWSIVASPNPGTSNNDLYGVAAFSTSDVWAVGSDDSGYYRQTLIEHWNGSAWSVVASPNPGTYGGYLYGVAAVSANDVWAIGSYYSSTSQTLIEHWNGTAWSVVASPNVGTSNNLNGVTVVSASDIWAVGNDQSGSVQQTLTEHWDGSAWNVVASPSRGSNNQLDGVATVSASDVWAVGSYYSGTVQQTLTEHWNGSAWSIIASPNVGTQGSYFYGVTAVSASDVWAVGVYVNSPLAVTLTEHWDGSAWSVVASPNVGTQGNGLNGVAAVSTNDVWAVGDYHDAISGTNQTLVEHYSVVCGTPTPMPPSPTNTPSPSATPQPTVCANPFVDITSNIFFHAINYLNCHGVINGTDATHYTPAGTATRGQFAKIVVLGFGEPDYTPSSGQDFSDVPPSYFAYVYIESGFHAGILSGFDQASCTAHGVAYPCYLPNLAITRAQLTKLVVGATHYPLYTPTTGQTFTDVPPSNIFYAFIETAYNKGVIAGYPDGTFRPNNNIRRDEMAQIVYKGVTTP